MLKDSIALFLASSKWNAFILKIDETSAGKSLMLSYLGLLFILVAIGIAIWMQKRSD